MDDYDFNREALRPNKQYGEAKSNKIQNKQKATTQRSKSKQKLIVTSFSKKQLANINSHRSPPTTTNVDIKKMAEVESPKKSKCQSEYYFKTAETKTQLDPLQLQDDVRVKDGQIQILSGKLAKAETLVKQLTAQNQLKSQRIETLEKQMNALIAKSLKSLQTQHFGVDLTYECVKYKQDQKRLLKMLETTAEYHYFSKFGLIDDGLQFLTWPNQNKKSPIDLVDVRKPVHFCSCNQKYISESSFWVPEKIYDFGKEFIVERKGELTKSEYQLLLYELNRLWRERQKKIINTLNGEKARQIEKYKRREANFHSLQKASVQKIVS